MRNRVSLIGHLGADPESKDLEGGKNLTKMNIATNDFYRNSDGEKVQSTQWHNLIAWGKTGEIAAKFLKKGSEVAIEGKLQTRSYEDKEGNTKYMTEIVVNDLVLLGKA